MILFINTADESKVFIGLAENKVFLAGKEFLAKHRQAEKLLIEISSLLNKNKYNLQSIKKIAVVQGPGPFTALRIGIATANALSWSLKIPVAGIRLTDFNNFNSGFNLNSLEFKDEKKDKMNLINPYYGREPNITLKKNSD